MSDEGWIPIGPLEELPDLADGRVMRGPATEPARTYETRVTEGVVEIRPR